MFVEEIKSSSSLTKGFSNIYNDNFQQMAISSHILSQTLNQLGVDENQMSFRKTIL